jgi:hypothetical protein
MSRWLAILVSLSVALSSTPGFAKRTDICEQLWYKKTAIYARKGYCFTNDRERSVFGHACFAPYGKLTHRQQRAVDDLKRQERRNGC